MEHHTSTARTTFGANLPPLPFMGRLNQAMIDPSIVVPHHHGIRFEDGAPAGTAGTPAAGGAGAAAPAAPAPGQPAGTPPNTPTAPGTPGSTPPAPAPGAPAATDDAELTADLPDGTKFADLPKTTQDEVKRLRASDRTHRARINDLTEQSKGALTAAERKELGKLLGYEKDAAPATEDLASSVSALTEKNLASERANMVLRVAPGVGANADVLLDSEGFKATIKGLDPTDRPGIETAVKSWISTHPYASATPAIGVAASSGGVRPQGDVRTPVRQGLAAAVSGAVQDQFNRR